VKILFARKRENKRVESFDWKIVVKEWIKILE